MEPPGLITRAGRHTGLGRGVIGRAPVGLKEQGCPRKDERAGPRTVGPRPKRGVRRYFRVYSMVIVFISFLPPGGTEYMSSV